MLIRISNLKKRDFSILYYVMILAVLVYALASAQPSAPASAETQYNWEGILNAIFRERNALLLAGDTEKLKAMYAPDEQNSKWAIALETIRAAHLMEWSARQGVSFTGISSELVIKRVRRVGRGYAFYVMACTTYTYAYENLPEKENTFRIGTYHSLDLIPGSKEDSWVISREWYLDPFQDALSQDAEDIAKIRQYVLAQPERDFSGISEHRQKAVAYADRYAGAASDGQNGYAYNGAYPNFISDGDCGNYVSQSLHESGFATGYGWNFDSDEATRSWCNAAGLEGYLVWSGKAYVIAQGAYKKVYPYAYQLAPGDVIAYVQKGKIVHVALVTGADSRGYALVNSHTTDRFRVPWDLGWNSANNKFILLRVNYPS
jgi:hypothetical protein